MAIENKRYIQIPDTEVIVGFNYPKQQFYVTNKETTTYRTETTDTLDVLETLGITSITEEQLLFLKNNWETLDNIYYTWDKTGSFIHSIQFNNWDEYPIIMDCYKAKMYIQNSTTIFDLNANESAEIVRVPLIHNFYQQTLGLELSSNVLIAIYNMLLSYYNPEAISSRYKDYFLTHRCTNQIAPRSEDDKDREAKYTGVFQTSNFTDDNPLEYICTTDPNNNPIPTQIGNISSVNADTNTITLTRPIQDIYPYKTDIGSQVIISGASTVVDEETYSLDGTYTITDISTDKTIITTEETPTTSYEYPYNTCYVLDTAPYTITGMSRDNNTITVLENPTTILVGDTITVTGAIISTTYEDISLNGRYTVSSITKNVITVEAPNTVTETTNTEQGSSTSNYEDYVYTDEEPYIDPSIYEPSNYEIITQEEPPEDEDEPEETNTEQGSSTGEATNAEQGSSTEAPSSMEEAPNTVTEEIVEYIITVEEPIPTDFSGTGATLTKEIFVSDIIDMTEYSIKLLTKIADLPEKIKNNLVSSTLIVYNNSIGLRQQTQVNAEAQLGEDVIPVTTSLNTSMEEFPQLQYPVPNPETNISIVKTIDTEILPTGDFMVDSFNEVVLYLSLLKDNKGRIIPTLPTVETDSYGNRSIKDSMYNTIAHTLYVPVEIKGQTDPDPQPLYLKGFGIYQEEYKSENQE